MVTGGICDDILAVPAVTITLTVMVSMVPLGESTLLISAHISMVDEAFSATV